MEAVTAKSTMSLRLPITSYVTSIKPNKDKSIRYNIALKTNNRLINELRKRTHAHKNYSKSYPDFFVGKYDAICL